MPVKCKIKILDDNAEIPTRAHASDTGFDLKFVSVKKIVGDVIFFGTGISVQPSQNYYFEIAPRSSISKLPLSLANSIGVIDNGYTGEIMVPIRVHHEVPSKMHHQDSNVPTGIVTLFGKRCNSMTIVAEKILSEKPKMCQMILRKRFVPEFVTEDVEVTERAEGGFGSTGD